MFYCKIFLEKKIRKRISMFHLYTSLIEGVKNLLYSFVYFPYFILKNQLCFRVVLVSSVSFLLPSTQVPLPPQVSSLTFSPRPKQPNLHLQRLSNLVQYNPALLIRTLTLLMISTWTLCFQMTQTLFPGMKRTKMHPTRPAAWVLFSSRFLNLCPIHMCCLKRRRSYL